jgi:L-alanine-DL-glutamate epimerase-like enolase superfamily enzyme
MKDLCQNYFANVEKVDMKPRSLEQWHRTLPIRGVFSISRGSKTLADSIVVRIGERDVAGYGECVPYGRYGESIESVAAQIESVTGAIEEGIDLQELQRLLPPGSARNAIDCALWDLRSRLSGRTVASFAGLQQPLGPVITAFTLSLADPQAMADKAREFAHLPLLKLKLGGEGDLERVRAVRKAAPQARLMADANESWQVEHLNAFLPEFAELGVELLEQPLSAGADEALLGYASPVPLAADESCRDLGSVADISRKYAFANIKLDKTGGLTEALALADAARSAGMKIMVGCMVASSLSMAPGIVLAQTAEVVHLDGPLLLARDYDPALRYEGARLYPDSRVWSI